MNQLNATNSFNFDFMTKEKQVTCINSKIRKNPTPPANALRNYTVKIMPDWTISYYCNNYVF